MGALGGLVYFMSICVECSSQNWCCSIFQPTVTILNTVLDCFLYEIFLKTGVKCNYIQNNVGLG